MVGMWTSIWKMKTKTKMAFQIGMKAEWTTRLPFQKGIWDMHILQKKKLLLKFQTIRNTSGTKIQQLMEILELNTFIPLVKSWKIK